MEPNSEERIKLVIGLQEIIDKQKGGSDVENDHADADDLLLAYINDKEISEMYEAIDKWYA